MNNTFLSNLFIKVYGIIFVKWHAIYTENFANFNPPAENIVYSQYQTNIVTNYISFYVVNCCCNVNIKLQKLVGTKNKLQIEGVPLLSSPFTFSLTALC